MQTKEAIKKYIELWGCDGHSIIKSESLVEMGFDQEFVNSYSYDHQSGQSYKSMIFDKRGNKMSSVMGVYTLDFLYAMAKDCGADITEARNKMGRGFQAGCLVAALQKVIE